MAGRAAMRYADQHKGLWRARVIVPPDLIDHLPAPYTGRKRFLQSTGIPVNGGDATAAQRVIDRYVHDVAEPVLAQARLAAAGGGAVTIEVKFPAHRLTPVFVERSITAARVVGANHLRFRSEHLSDAPVDLEAVVRLWIDERTAAGDPPKDKAVRNKRSKMNALFRHIGKTDMAAITADDLHGYRRHLLPAGIGRDHLIDIKALFAVAKRGRLIIDNPAADLDVPPKVVNKRPPFSDNEARRILIAARDAEPVVRWSHWLAAFTTGINSEIMAADEMEFYQTTDGQWVWDTRERKLKTEFRPRITPLHPAIIREGFPAYLATRKGKKLFDDNPTIGSIKVNAFIRDLEIDKTFYSWRHRVVHRLNKLTTPSLSRFIAGHAAKDIHEKFYLHHELPEEFGEIVTAIEGLKDPTG